MSNPTEYALITESAKQTKRVIRRRAYAKRKRQQRALRQSCRAKRSREDWN